MAQPNVLLVVLDSVRARNLGCYGHANQTTPFLEAFSDRATLYTQARSTGVHSIASHVSLFTGYEVEEHRLVEHGAKLDSTESVWDGLSNAGYETGLFTPNAVVTRASNLGEPFDTVVGPKRRDVPYPSALTLSDIEDESRKVRAFIKQSVRHDQPVRSFANGVSMKLGRNVSHAPEEEAASVYLDSFCEWLGDRTGPWGACLNLMDAHYPYVPAPEFDHWGNDRLRRIHEAFPDGPGIAAYLNGDRPWWEVRALEALYDGCIRQLDAAMERLVETLKAAGAFEDTYLVITSDHGECFGEPTLVRPDVRTIGHRYSVTEPLTHVPLLTKRPGQTNGHQVTDPTSIARFPEAVDSVLSDPECGPAFDTRAPVLTSTYRLRADGSLASHLDDPDPFLGPWRAAYEAVDGTVVKRTERGTDQAVVTVRDAQTSFRTSTETGGSVEDAFDGLQSVSIGRGESGSLDGDVESHLEDLGYLR